MIYIGNAFSVGMLGAEEATLRVAKVSIETVKAILMTEEVKSVVGHEASARLLSTLLDRDIPFNREAIKLQKGDALIVFQLLDRLPEGIVLGLDELRKIKYTFYLVAIA